MQKNLAKLGTKLPQGTIVKIANNGVVVDNNGKQSKVDFATVEQALCQKGK